MKTYRSRTGRLTATVTGRGKEIGPIEAHQLNVLAVTRRIHACDTAVKDRQRRIRRLTREIAELRKTARAHRRELAAILQRDQTID